ncbi:hypothetical protein [Paracoccus lutimaris]|uniref:hypothetical protein n=1 Tax=Paracoccus lutimaris TaxID=1490030 RepID=UPI000DF4112B|nr:hypothetical protein [Paracoccus lutimaris]
MKDANGLLRDGQEGAPIVGEVGRQAARGTALQLKRSVYVDASRAIGVGAWAISCLRTCIRPPI